VKKVAIMTWYNYTNFGTVFQAVALFNTVLKLGYYPMIIHYIPHQKLVTRKGIYKRLNFYGKMLEEMINKYIINQNLIKDEKRDRAFESFLNRYVKLTVPCKTDSELFRLNEEFDAFICGSDQIWAPTLFNSKYFLDFVQDENKMISYAPSIGLPVIEDKYVRHLMKQYIGRFKHLSVREEQGKYLIQELCGKEAIVVLDPTLLLTTNEWNNMTSYKIESDPYILCYFLGTNSQSMSSCYECNFRTASAADIRMGDYWGPRFKSNKNGVSMVITMTSRGEEILQELYKAGRIELKQTNCEEYWTVQYPQNPIKPVFYDELMEELRDDSIPLKKIVDKYCREYEFSSRLARLYGYVKRIYKLAEGIFIV